MKPTEREILVRLFDGEWERWDMLPFPRKAVDPDDPAHVVSIPARQVIAAPLWIEGTDETLATEAARLELDVRGLIPKNAPVNAVVMRLLPVESRMLVVAAVFPGTLSADVPSDAADRFDASPFLTNVPADSLSVWREGDDLVAVVTRGSQVILWETNDRDAEPGVLRTWLSLILTRLRGEGFLEKPPRFVCHVEGISPDRIAPADCAPAPADEGEVFNPAFASAKFQWQPEAVVLAGLKRVQRARIRKIAFAVAGAYLVAVLGLGIYFGILRVRAAMLQKEAASLTAEVQSFQPIENDWTSVLGRTAETDRFPLEILSAVVAAMPPGGIQLTQFTITDKDEITVEGEADSIIIANDYSNKVVDTKVPVDWERHNPVPLPNNTAKFTISGRLRQQ